jgi:hypothetical protein
MMAMTKLNVIGVFGTCLLLSVSAHAQESGFSYENQNAPLPNASAPMNPPETSDQGATATPPSNTTNTPPPPTERPFLYLVDPTLPQPWHVMASYSAGYSSTGGGTRPLAATAGRGGLVNQLRVEGALGDRVAPFATGMLAPPLEGEASPKAAVNGGVRVLLTDPDSRKLRLIVAGGYERDFAPTNDAFLRVTATYDIGNLRLASMLHSEHAFAPGRDPIDIYVDEGVSYRVLDSLRVGAEYVGQELEGAWEQDEAEGGIRHFVGADVAWSYQNKVLLTAGPAFGLSHASPRVLGQATLSYLF